MIHVLAVGAGVREALEALGALKGLFAAMQSLVFGQMMLMFERPWALHAFVRPLPCGHSFDLSVSSTLYEFIRLFAFGTTRSYTDQFKCNDNSKNLNL